MSVANYLAAVAELQTFDAWVECHSASDKLQVKIETWATDGDYNGRSPPGYYAAWASAKLKAEAPALFAAYRLKLVAKVAKAHKDAVAECLRIITEEPPK